MKKNLVNFSYLLALQQILVIIQVCPRHLAKNLSNKVSKI